LHQSRSKSVIKKSVLWRILKKIDLAFVKTNFTPKRILSSLSPEGFQRRSIFIIMSPETPFRALNPNARDFHDALSVTARPLFSCSLLDGSVFLASFSAAVAALPASGVAQPTVPLRVSLGGGEGYTIGVLARNDGGSLWVDLGSMTRALRLSLRVSGGSFLPKRHSILPAV